MISPKSRLNPRKPLPSKVIFHLLVEKICFPLFLVFFMDIRSEIRSENRVCVAFMSPKIVKQGPRDLSHIFIIVFIVFVFPEFCALELKHEKVGPQIRNLRGISSPKAD